MTPYVFISHRSLDKAFAFAIAEVLRLAGVRYYLDAEDPLLADNPDGRAVVTSVEGALRLATHVVAIVSPFSRNSWWISYEIGVARQRGATIVAVVQSDVRTPQFLDNATQIDRRESLIEWVSSLGSHPVLDPDLLRRLDSWITQNPAQRTSLYRNAIDHIQSLWRPEAWTSLRLQDCDYAFRRRWMGCASDELIHILYSILAPLAALKSRATGLSEAEGVLIDEAYKVFSNDELLARLEPARRYSARKCTDWKNLRRDNPAEYWLQGLLPRDLDLAIACMRAPSGDLLSRETVAATYKTLFQGSDGSAQKPLGLAANALQGFELATRPIYARLMAVQARLYNALLRLEQKGETYIHQPDLFDLEPASPISCTIEESISNTYVQCNVAPQLSVAMGQSPTRA